MPQGDDNHQEHIVLNRVDDPVITYSDSHPIAAPKTDSAGRPRILPQQCNGAMNAFAVIRMHFSERP